MTDSEYLLPRFDKKISRIRDFAEEYKGLWECVEGLLFFAVTFAHRIPLLPRSTLLEHRRYIMLVQVLDYLRESLFLLLDIQFDAALALLRMAAELARDIRVIGNDAAKMEIWDKRDDPIVRKQFHAEFRFNDNDSAEVIVHRLYTIASRAAIHGHRTSFSKSSHIATNSQGGVQYAVMGVNRYHVLELLLLWMESFHPIAEISMKQFFIDRKEETGVFEETFREFRRLYPPLVKVVRTNMESLKTELEDIAH